MKKSRILARRKALGFFLRIGRNHFSPAKNWQWSTQAIAKPYHYSSLGGDYARVSFVGGYQAFVSF